MQRRGNEVAKDGSKAGLVMFPMIYFCRLFATDDAKSERYAEVMEPNGRRNLSNGIKPQIDTD
jgi:hypothetical protein